MTYRDGKTFIIYKIGEIIVEKLSDSELMALMLGKLRMRFRKIDSSEYYLSYSGGMDSHVLLHFIKEILCDDDILVVGVNTLHEHNEIRRRIYRHCDEVLLPRMSMRDIKEKYGIPCFTKHQDEMIERYQGGCRTDYLMSRITGTGTTQFGLNKVARLFVLSDSGHKVSNKCCKYTKKEPLRLYEKRSGRKAIVGVRKGESVLRKASFHSCLSKSGKFTPLYDFTDDMIQLYHKHYMLEIPDVYKVLDRTGCAGCPYGYHGRKMTTTELSLLTPSQRRWIIDTFGESYDILGIDYGKDEEKNCD